MKTSRKYISTLLLLLISIGIYAQSSSLQKSLPEVPNPPHLVNDLGDMLSPNEEQELESKLFQYEQSTSNEITIVTLESIGEFEISEYANELGRKWDIGKASKKNGVLILASKNDRKINISPTYGLSGVLPDGVCGSIIRQQIVPNFKRGDYYTGFDEAVNMLQLRIGNEFTADQLPNGSQGISPLGLLFLLIIFGLFIFVFFFMIRNRTSTYVSRRGWTHTDDTYTGGGGFFGGGSSWGSDSDSGGGFGGFGGGGGGFDGGGASGSW
jgi:uncharacterized protein